MYGVRQLYGVAGGLHWRGQGFYRRYAWPSAHGEPGLVGEVDEGQVERLAEFQQPEHLLAGRDVHRTAVEARVVAHDPAGDAVDAGEAGDAGLAVERPDLEEAALVDDGIDDRVGIVGPAPVLRNDGQQRLVAPVLIVVRRPLRRRLPDARGQIREEPAHLGDRVGLVLGEVHDDAVPDLSALVAQFFLGDPLAGRLLDHLRAADEHLARALDHHAEVAEARLHGR